MMKVIQRFRVPLLIVLVSLLLPSAAYAQAVITGVVKAPLVDRGVVRAEEVVEAHFERLVGVH